MEAAQEVAQRSLERSSLSHPIATVNGGSPFPHHPCHASNQGLAARRQEFAASVQTEVQAV